MIGKRFYLAMLILGSFSCSKDETKVQLEVSIPLEVQPYIDRFLGEGLQRQKEIDLADYGIEITFQKGLEGDLAAFCNNGKIVISQQVWDARSDGWREAMLFHELGHCILHRDHYNALLPNDEWVSLMRGEPFPNARNSYINFSGDRREYYIDELFDQNTSVPEWVHHQEPYLWAGGGKDTVLNLINIASFANSMKLPDSSDFEIEVLIDIQNTTSNVGLAWGGIQPQDGIVVHYNAEKTFIINAGLRDQGIIFQRDHFALLNDHTNLISVRMRNDKFYIFVNQKFIYWMDVKAPFVNRFWVLANFAGPPNFKQILVYKLLPT